MELELKYGEELRPIRIPDKADVTILKPNALPELDSIQDALQYQLEQPTGSLSLLALLQGKRPERIAIAIPDETRPAPVKEIVPPLLVHIYRTLPNLKASAINIVIGGGLHPPPDLEVQQRILPQNMVPGCNILLHDANNSPVTEYGVTSRGTPVKINADFAAADFKIVIGQIDPHQFVGFTGGSKGATIGCASAETIEHNHGLMFSDHAKVGVHRDNPVREDLNEAGRMIGLDFAINVVMNTEKKVVQLLAGDPEAVLFEGSKTCAAVYGVNLTHKFDIVVASCGGLPKDISLYQAQKGLNLASHAVKKGGKILLLAACTQGVGDDIYFDYVCQFATPDEVLHDFQNLGFKMGAHKAYLFGRTLANYDVAVLTDLDPAILRKCQLRAADPSQVITEWVDGFEKTPQLAIIPNANTTYFLNP
jgi:nickel-dependent lactate racemase